MVNPMFLLMEEQSQGDRAGTHRNDSRANDMNRIVVQLVVGRTEVSHVMHSCDSQSSNDTAANHLCVEHLDTTFFELSISNGEAEKQEDDWNEDGKRGEAGVVVELN